MTAIELLCHADERGVALSVQGDRILACGQAEAVGTLKPEIAAHKVEIIALLNERDSLAGRDFTAHGYLCRRCKGIARVAVIDGEITCTFCVLSEAERLVSKREGASSPQDRNETA
jgi:hypothetical protein